MKQKILLFLLSLFFVACNSDEQDEIELEDLGIEELSHTVNIPSQGGIKTLVSEGKVFWITFIDINGEETAYLEKDRYLRGDWFILEDKGAEGIRITMRENKTGNKRTLRVGLQLIKTNNFDYFIVHQESE